MLRAIDVQCLLYRPQGVCGVLAMLHRLCLSVMCSNISVFAREYMTVTSAAPPYSNPMAYLVVLTGECAVLGMLLAWHTGMACARRDQTQ